MNEDYYVNYGGCFPRIAAMVIAVALMAMMMSGCKTREVVTVVTEQHTDTLIITKERRDSIHVRDSVYLHEYTKNDTVFVEKTRVNIVAQERLRIDTVYRAKVDSVPVPYPVVKEVNKLHSWQKWLMWTGVAAILGLLIFIGYRVWRACHP